MIASLWADQCGCDPRVCAGSLDEVRCHASEAVGCDLALLDLNLGPGAPSGVDAYGWLCAQGYQG